MAKDQIVEGNNFLEGKLLIALPGLDDPRFEKSVIYMCAHSSEGAMGLIVNRPIDGLGFHEMARKLNLGISQITPDFPILYGGPMETGRGFVLHSTDYTAEGATQTVSTDIALTATLDILRAISEGRGPQHAMFTLGYAGWGPGQIESEIQLNGWVHCDADKAILFDTAPDAKWSLAMRKLGIDLSALSSNAGRA